MENVTNIVNVSTTGMPSLVSDYDVIPKETMKLMKTICYLGVTPALVVCGLVLNSLCFVLFYKVQPKTSTVVMLSGLTLADFLFLLNGAVNSMMQATALYGRPFNREQRMVAVLFFSTYINTVPGKIGNCLTFCISVERLLCVLKPLKIRQYSTKKSAIIVVLSSYIFTMIACLPNLFLYEMTTIESNKTGQVVTKNILKATEYGKNERLTNAAYVSQESILYYIPVIGVMFASLATAVLIIVQGKRRAILSKGSTKLQKLNQEIQVTRMLLVVTSIFVLCKLPGTILRMIVFIHPDQTPFKYLNNTYEAAMAVIYVIMQCNSVVNFIIYYKTSTVYRKVIQKVFNFNMEAETRFISSSSSTVKTIT